MILILSQGETEQALLDLLTSLGGEVAWQKELTGLTQDEGAVTATIRSARNHDREVRADWLVGCEAARSAVRHRLGLSFRGLTPDS